MIAFCWRGPNADYTAEICMHCAGHSDEKLAEMTQQRAFPDRVACMLELIKACDELEAMGSLETIGINPVTGSKRRRLSAKGRQELADLEDEAERPSKH